MTTIRQRLLLLLLPALALLMLLGGVADYWIAVASTRNAYDQALASSALAAAASLRSEDGAWQPSTAQRAAVTQRAAADGSRLYSIIGPAGELIAGTAQLPAALPAASAAADAGRGGGTARGDTVRSCGWRACAPTPTRAW